MRKKKDDKTSKKSEHKEQEKVIQDRTFGLKNKNKSTKVQKFVKSVVQKVKGVVGKGGEQAIKDKEFKDRIERKKLQEKEDLIASLSKSVNSVKQQQPKEGEDCRSILCAFFKAGVCKKGDKCKFSHDLDIEKRAAKADLYTDIRGSNKTGDMTSWDQGYLEQVIAEKNQKRGPVPSPIICKYFLDAVEGRVYGWFWDCPNGEQCQYRHCLPPGFVLQRDINKSKDLEKLEEKRIEEIVDAERDELHKKPKLTPLTLENFVAWKKRKQEEREKKMADEIKKASKSTGGKAFNMLTGRALFRYDPTAFKDEDDAVEEYKEEAEAAETATETSKEEDKEVSYRDWNVVSREEQNIKLMLDEVKKADKQTSLEEAKAAEEQKTSLPAAEPEKEKPKEEKAAEPLPVPVPVPATVPLPMPEQKVEQKVEPAKKED